MNYLIKSGNYNIFEKCLKIIVLKLENQEIYVSGELLTKWVLQSEDKNIFEIVDRIYPINSCQFEVNFQSNLEWVNFLLTKNNVSVRFKQELNFEKSIVVFTNNIMHNNLARTTILNILTHSLWNPKTHIYFCLRIQQEIYTFLLVHNRFNLVRLLPRPVVYKIFNYLY